MKQPDDATLAWVETVTGPFRVVSHFAHSHAYSNLWRLAAGSDYVWLKMHAHPHKWAGEVNALTRWAKSLSPQLLGWRDVPPTVLLTEMSGVDAESIDYTPSAEARLWSEAGAWLRDFHNRTNAWMGNLCVDGTPFEEPTDDARIHVRKNFDKRLYSGRELGILTEKEFNFAHRIFERDLPTLEGASIHSVHRDFTPRNWLAHSTGELTAVIDFEHARWDVAAADLNRPWDKEFARNPQLEDAFYEAYGRPDERFETQIQVLRLFNVVAGVVWAIEVGDPEFSEFNRVALHRMMAA